MENSASGQVLFVAEYNVSEVYEGTSNACCCWWRCTVVDVNGNDGGQISEVFESQLMITDDGDKLLVVMMIKDWIKYNVYSSTIEHF